MEIFGFGLVALCMFIGSYIGVALGKVLGISGNVGGVGFAMLILVLYTNYLEKKGKPLAEGTKNGIKLLSGLYIPIIVAMSAIQNVVSAFSGGLVAFLAGTISTLAALFMIPGITRAVQRKEATKK